MTLAHARSLPAPILLLVLCAGQSLAAANNVTIADADDKALEDKFQQYSLPYGVLGAISHILTLWVMGCHFYGRTPWVPWRPLKYNFFNMSSTVGSSLVSIGIAVFTLSRIQETQALVVLAAMQVVLSLMLDAVNVHRYFAIRRRVKYETIDGDGKEVEKVGLIRGMVLWGAILYGVSYASIYAMAQMSSKLQFAPTLLSPRLFLSYTV